MSKIPITIKRYIDLDSLYGSNLKFQVSVSERGHSWEKTFTCGINDLIKFRDEINNILDSCTWYEQEGIDKDLAVEIEKVNSTDNICAACNFKKSQKCATCVSELQSPLERKLYSKLLETNIYFKVQYPMNRYGKQASLSDSEAKDLRLKYIDLLTQVDFYIPKGNTNLCVYTDGHNYHERTEEQAHRDRNIDRKLQELGYKVLRFTGMEINQSIDKVINQILSFIKN